MPGEYAKDRLGLLVDFVSASGQYVVDRPGDWQDTGSTTPGAYSFATTFITTANENFSSTTYTDFSGATNQTIALESGKEYGILMNGSLNTNSGGDSIWQIGLNLDDGAQVIDVGNFRLNHADGKSWESAPMFMKFTSSGDHVSCRPQIKRVTGTGEARSGIGREWGLLIFEMTNEFIIPQVPTSTGTWSDSNWHDVPGAGTEAVSILSGETYAALMALKHYQSSGAPQITARADFNSGVQTVAGYRSWDGLRNEHDNFIETFTAVADLTITKLQVSRTNGTGTYQIINGVQQDLALLPIDADTQYFEWTQSSTQDTTSATYIDLNGVTDTACTLEAGQKYVAIINCFCAGNISGGGDVRFGMNFDNGGEVIDAGFIEVQATESRQIESAIHVVPFILAGDRTTLRLQAKRIAGSVTLRFNGTYKYQMLIRKVNN